MNTHTNKKVICIKDIPSNLIEEAIFILKTDEIEEKNSKFNFTRKDIILKETEELVKEYSEEFDNIEVDEKKENINLNEFILKVVLGTILFVLVCYFISIII